MKIITEFKLKFKTEELKIYETEYWNWSLRPVQATIGSGILSLKRECPTFGEVNLEEYIDLNKIIKVIESTLKKTFNYDIMNYLMLMMVDKHVHYHVIPRYENRVEFEGRDWLDESWPGVPNLAGEELDIETLKLIAKEMKNKIIQ